MDMLWYGLKVALIGMGVVFVGLIILIGCIKALKGARPAQMNESPETGQPAAPPAEPLWHPPVAPSVPQAPRTYVNGPKLTRKDDALYAVLAAAIAATLEAEGRNPEGGFAIRSVTPVHA